MKRTKTIMFVGAGPEMVPGILWAREMGLRVVATDINPRAAGFEYVDDYAIASTRDAQANVAAARRWHGEGRLNGVMTLAADVPYTVAMVAAEFGLPGLSPEVARTAQDKLLMKLRLRERGVPLPRFAAAKTLGEARRAAEQVGYPLVVKPVNRSGARGVSLVDGAAGLTEAVDWARAHSEGSDTLLLEEYLRGPQVSTETLAYNGVCYTTGFADRNYEHNGSFYPYFIEDGHTIPSALGDAEQGALKDVAERAVSALGIDCGVGKGDLVLTPEGPKVIEIAARLSGGRFSTDTVPMASGINVVKAVIRMSVGEPVKVSELRPKWHRAAAQRYLFPAPGRVTRIVRPDGESKPDWLTRIELYVEPGMEIGPVTNHTQRAGYVITAGETREEAVRRAQWARAQTRIYTEPVEQVAAGTGEAG